MALYSYTIMSYVRYVSLQFFFNNHVFREEQAQYEVEGIDWQNISFTNNDALLDLFLKVGTSWFKMFSVAV